MKNLYDSGVGADIDGRLANLRADSQRQWGKMNLAQALAHCSGAMEFAVGDVNPPRMLIGRLVGWAVKRKSVAGDAPLEKNTPTAKGLVIEDQRDLERERARLRGLLNRFVAAGPSGCTKHPHSFFGDLTPEEWSTLMYKHLDHHLRQFGA